MFFEINEYYFYRIALAKNITKAAEEIHISQPALSKAMAKLEEKIGCQLLYRNQKGIELTQAGKILFDGVKQSMDIMEKTVNQISRISYSDYGEISIGGGDDLFIYFMIPVIREYCNMYPNVLIRELIYSNSEQTIKGLLKKDINIGLLNKCVDDDRLEFVKITEMHEVVVSGEKYAALAKVAPLKWSALAEFPIIMHCSNTHTRKLFDEKLEKMGVQFKAYMEVGSTAIMLNLALEGFGLAIVTKEIAQMDYRYSQLTEIPMDPPLSSRDTYVAWNREVTMTSCMNNLVECITRNTSGNFNK
ncbi:MAG: LysR family transcriptional regulator [Lachnospiraceae bacterium]|nr:LysR family transcriptional regulator [Lachnospiraceae bacterium]